MTILVSACLIGINCKYNGGNNYHLGVVEYLEDKIWVPVCPEQLGGLSTPRRSIEISEGDGETVLQRKAKALSKDGQDFTDFFIQGAKEVLRIAQLVQAEEVIFKERSPSCGSTIIYDGSFQHKQKPGMGITVALLKRYGIKVFSEQDFS